MVAFFVFRKICLRKSCSSSDKPLQIYHITKFRGPSLTGASLALTSEVWRSAILECLQLQH
jgi:hypothetical protein